MKSAISHILADLPIVFSPMLQHRCEQDQEALDMFPWICSLSLSLSIYMYVCIYYHYIIVYENK